MLTRLFLLREHRSGQLWYDVAAAMARQGGFLRHVLRSCYGELPFLQRALDRYLRFVLLWRDSKPSLVVVPMYDVDLMWHAHMAHTGAYVRDMREGLGGGRVLFHDDNLEGAQLSDGFRRTKAAYEARWDMLYDPPLTQRVPEGEPHPAWALVGPHPARLLAGPLLADAVAYDAAREAGLAKSQVVIKARLYKHALVSAKHKKKEVSETWDSRLFGRLGAPPANCAQRQRQGQRRAQRLACCSAAMCVADGLMRAPCLCAPHCPTAV